MWALTNEIGDKCVRLALDSGPKMELHATPSQSFSINLAKKSPRLRHLAAKICGVVARRCLNQPYDDQSITAISEAHLGNIQQIPTL